MRFNQQKKYSINESNGTVSLELELIKPSTVDFTVQVHIDETNSYFNASGG